jgi:serine/threonine-protein kinase
MLTKSGVKLLDFGLAKQFGQASPVSGASILQTEVSAGAPLTERGTILGTFQYMSPEQLEGKDADARSDIFAFGCVLYEMATGRKAFSGKSQASLIASILEHDPDPISSIQPLVPPALDRVIRTCLAKDPDDRWQTAHDLSSELKWIAAAGSQTGAPATVRARPRSTSAAGWAIAAGMALLAAILGVLLVRASSRAAEQEQRVLHTQFLPPKGDRIVMDLYRGFAISPDGSRLVYAAARGVTSELRLRALDSAESSAIPGSEGGTSPFFSPDGKWIGFIAGPKLKKVALSGGTPVTLCDAPNFRGGVWAEDGSIYVVPNVYVPISRIPADGGALSAVTSIRSKEGEQQHRWPDLLPGGKVLIYTVGTGGDWDDALIVAERIGTGERKVLVKGGSSPRYLSTGHLVYARAGALYAVSFDARSLKVEGAPVEVARNVLLNAMGFANMDVSRNGILAAAPSDASMGDLMLSWIDREGRAEPLKVVRQPYLSVGLSSDGGRAAVSIGNGISILDLARSSWTKLTLPARAEAAVWSRDGRKLFFGYEREKYFQVFSKSTDDSGAAQLVFASPSEEDPYSLSADGSRMLTIRTSPDGLHELQVRSMNAGSSEEKPKVLLKSLFIGASAPGFSPDGRWVAYESVESGRPEIYVRPSSGEERKWQVSTEGGSTPAWSPAGDEIFFLCGMKLVSVPVASKGEDFVIGAAKVLFESHHIFYFDVTRDAKRFLVAEDPNPGAQSRLDLTINWFAEVRRKVREAKAP